MNFSGQKTLKAASPQVHDYIENTAAHYPTKIALIANQKRYTYAELDQTANTIANFLVENGICRGDRVVVFGDNTVETVIAFWSTLKANAVVSIANPLTKADKLAEIINDCEASALICESQLAPIFLDAMQHCPSLMVVLVSGDHHSQQIASETKAIAWKQALQCSSYAPLRQNIDLDLAAIIYTSGTTGEPKGAMFTHRNMITSATSISQYLENTSNDVVLGVLPLSFSYGLYQLIVAFREAATIVLERSFMYPAQVLNTMMAERITGFAAVPTIFALLSDFQNIAEYDFSSVRYVTNAASALPPKHLETIKKIFPNAKFYSMYGQTECTRGTYLPPEALETKPTSVGIAIPNTEIWIVDDNNICLGPNQVGQLVIRGGTVMRGYWGKPEQTATKLRPGPIAGEVVLYTGDYFRMDEDGFFYFVSRMDDIIKSRGEKVPPKEVEHVIDSIDGIHEVAVIGVADDVLGQAIKAFIVRKPGSTVTDKEIRRQCQQHLESFMVPKFIEFVDELPKTTSGKIKKTNLQ